MAKRTKESLLEEAEELGLNGLEDASWDELRDAVEQARGAPVEVPPADPEDRPPRRGHYNRLGVWEIS
jgi:hypothetical protein